jgi:phage protein D
MPDRQRDAVVPAFQILVNGSVIPPEAATDMFLLEVSDSVDEIGMFTLSLNAGDPRTGRVKWVDTDLFREGSDVVVKIGVQPPLTELIAGELTGLEPEFPAQGPIQLVVRGYERLYRLGHGRKSRSFRNVKDSDIAAQIAGDWKLTPDVEATSVTHEYVFQNNQTDLEFLQERARRIRYEVRCSGKKLLFRKPGERAGATATLSFGQEILSFSARLSLVSQTDAVHVHGWSAKDKKEIVGKATSGDEMKLGGRDTGVALVKRVVGADPVVAVLDPPDSAEDAEVMAQAGLNARAFDFVIGEGTCMGNGAVRAGAVVELKELGTRFSGAYYVTASTHSVSTRRGYTTHFSVRRSAA